MSDNRNTLKEASNEDLILVASRVRLICWMLSAIGIFTMCHVVLGVMKNDVSFIGIIAVLIIAFGDAVLSAIRTAILGELHSRT